MSPVSVSTSSLKEGRPYEYLVRFALGGGATVFTGIISSRYGASVGGLFLALPAIFCASATLIEKPSHVPGPAPRKGLLKEAHQRRFLSGHEGSHRLTDPTEQSSHRRQSRGFAEATPDVGHDLAQAIAQAGKERQARSIGPTIGHPERKDDDEEDDAQAAARPVGRLGSRIFAQRAQKKSEQRRAHVRTPGSVRSSPAKKLASSSGRRSR